MKKIKRRSLALFTVIALLGGGTLLFAIQFFVSGGTWAASRISITHWNSGTTSRGTVIDRDGVILADCVDGERVFAADEQTRRAALHVVGDVRGYIGTSAFTVFASRLAGWNIFTGLQTISETGGTVQLTISSELHKTALSALNGKNGAVVVLDYSTGEILCAVSSPTFDPLSPPEIENNSALEGIYLNRAFSSTYTPGSVYKIITAIAAVELLPGVLERTFRCDGVLRIGNDTVTCPSKHGNIAFRDAFSHSCNIVFATLAMEIGAEKLYNYAEKLGLLSSLNIDGITTAAGRYETSVPEIELAWSGVGQGENLASPIAMARLSAAIANGGNVPVLHISQDSRTARFENILNTETAAIIKELMLYTVESHYGVFPGLTLGAKSGTAEVGSGEPHSWFTGFSDSPDKPYAFAVIIENGGGGRAVAGEAAKKVMSAAATKNN